MTTYKLDDLAREAGVAARTVRYYVQRGLLPAPGFRGKDTTYGAEHLLRLRAVKQLQQAGLSLDEIEVRLAGSSAAELERIASEGATPAPAAADAPGGPPPRAARAGVYRLHAPGPVCDPAPRVERWERVVLMPGLELHVRADAAQRALRAAQAIQARFAHPEPGPDE